MGDLISANGDVFVILCFVEDKHTGLAAELKDFHVCYINFCNLMLDIQLTCSCAILAFGLAFLFACRISSTFVLTWATSTQELEASYRRRSGANLLLDVPSLVRYMAYSS